MGWWTKEKTEELKRYMDDSLPAKEIAVKLGPGFTKNSVIGKASRMGLTFPNTSARDPAVRKKIRDGKTVTHIPRATVRPKDRPPPLRPPIVPVADVVTQATRSFAPQTMETLEAHHCRFPIGDPGHPDFRFCGAQKFEGLSYCATHAKICFQNFVPGVGVVPTQRSRQTPRPTYKKEYV